MSFGGTSGNSSISGSTDVTLNNPSANQVLSDNSTTHKWGNTSLAPVASTGSFTDLSNKPPTIVALASSDPNPTPGSDPIFAIVMP